MRLTLAAVVAGLLGSLLLAGGCVSQEKYDALQAQNRAAQQELQRVMAALNEANARYATLEKTLVDLNAQLAAVKQENDLLKSGNGGMLAEINRLKAELEKLRNVGPVAPGSIPLPAGLNQLLVDLQKKYPDLFDYDETRGLLKFKSDMTFESGSDVVKDQAKQALTKLAEILNTDEAKPFHAYIAGHTDDQPIKKPETLKRHPTNWYLSAHRAVSVEAVMEKGGVSPSRLAAMGFGEYHPAAANAAGHKGNVVNRRVEIWIVPPERFMTVENGTEAPKADTPKADSHKAVAPKAGTPRTAAPKASAPEATETPAAD